MVSKENPIARRRRCACDDAANGMTRAQDVWWSDDDVFAAFLL